MAGQGDKPDARPTLTGRRSSVGIVSVEETPLSRLLWQRRGHETIKQVRVLASLDKQHGDKALNINFVDVDRKQASKPMMITTGDSVVKVATETASLFGWDELEVVDLNPDNGQGGTLQVIDEDVELSGS